MYFQTLVISRGFTSESNPVKAVNLLFSDRMYLYFIISERKIIIPCAEHLSNDEDLEKMENEKETCLTSGRESCGFWGI